ncbi:putative hydrolase of the HAD superfamily [Murinocardiopsis flavida]|uniref:Putative hydrolase of the HAD superfamily n=1 Tax=Murinocardiopsis flavida TaxID=645275 RepID=A0A2P8CVE4_9ACTN|nr:HAD-IA family hydrolase [Murinocardiopsis flavida]PSK88938.1 putative hydrolase of the HAD superfamily [Murinocardiopsis flavida]
MDEPIPRAVLCDLDGVLRHFAADQFSSLDAANGLPPGTVASVAFAPERLVPAITGVVTDEQWRSGVAAALAAACGSADRSRALVRAWSASSGSIDAEVLDLLTRARARVPVVLVTNATSRLDTDLAALGIADAFDGVLNSSRLGAAKPDPRVYRAAAALAGVPVGRCLFLDDAPRNVRAAHAAGMPAVLFRRPDDLRRALGPLL